MRDKSRLPAIVTARPGKGYSSPAPRLTGGEALRERRLHRRRGCHGTPGRGYCPKGMACTPRPWRPGKVSVPDGDLYHPRCRAASVVSNRREVTERTALTASPCLV